MAELPEVDEKIKNEFQLAQDLTNDLVEWMKGEMANYGNRVDPVVLSKMAVVALAQYGAAVAVDVGMTEQQFVNVCKASFVTSYVNAPKFG